MSISKHDSLCQLVSNRLRVNGWDVVTNLDYNVGGICGEFDVLGAKNGNFMYVECKSNPTVAAYKKAHKQLARADRFPFKNQRLFKVMAYWKNGVACYENVWRKKQ